MGGGHCREGLGSGLTSRNGGGSVRLKTEEEANPIISNCSAETFVLHLWRTAAAGDDGSCQNGPLRNGNKTHGGVAPVKSARPREGDINGRSEEFPFGAGPGDFLPTLKAPLLAFSATFNCLPFPLSPSPSFPRPLDDD